MYARLSIDFKYLRGHTNVRESFAFFRRPAMLLAIIFFAPSHLFGKIIVLKKTMDAYSSVQPVFRSLVALTFFSFVSECLIGKSFCDKLNVGISIPCRKKGRFIAL